MMLCHSCSGRSFSKRWRTIWRPFRTSGKHPLHLGKVGSSLFGRATPKVPGRWQQQGQGSETPQKDRKIDVCCLNKQINVSNSMKIQGVQRVNNTQRKCLGPHYTGHMGNSDCNRAITFPLCRPPTKTPFLLLPTSPQRTWQSWRRRYSLSCRNRQFAKYHLLWRDFIQTCLYSPRRMVVRDQSSIWSTSTNMWN